jgi:uncharacterized protein YdeI (YjbR/CyaY-like superfamily)
MIVAAHRVHSFETWADFERWLSGHHQREPEVWLKIHKKGSKLPSISAAEALDVCLCWGWIDGLRKGFDERSFLQRYTPRKSTSRWSKINQENVARLVAARRMTEHGLAQVNAAKADGRWAAAYAPMREATKATVPADLMRAISANAKARATFQSLDKANLFSLTYRTNSMKTAEGRARKIATLVSTLARGERINQARKKPARK